MGVAVVFALLMVIGCEKEKGDAGSGAAGGKGAQAGKGGAADGSVPAAVGTAVPGTPAVRWEALKAGAPAGAAGGKLFTRLTPEQTGVGFYNKLEGDHPWAVLYVTGFSGSSVAVGDYDGDGLPDLFLANHMGPNKLYRQVAPWKFEDVTEKAGVGGGAPWTGGVTMADVNNDGRLDIYVCQFNAPNQLFINQGDGTFKESAKAYGLDFEGSSMMAGFADFDRDGDLDLYLMTNRQFKITGQVEPLQVTYKKDLFGNPIPEVIESQKESYALIPKPSGQMTTVRAGQRDRLYRNNGDGTFAEVGREAGIIGYEQGLGLLWLDYDGDGWPDIYVANDFHGADHLFRNNRDGTFTDVAAEALPHTPWFSMGTDFGDVTNDGRLDIYATDMEGTSQLARVVGTGPVNDSWWFERTSRPRQTMRNSLFINSGTGRFLETACLSGVHATGWTWSVRISDLDNDGRLDIFVANGMIRNFSDSDIIEKAKELFKQTADPREYEFAYWKLLQASPERRERDIAYRNLGGMRFEDAAPAWGLDHEGISFGAVAVDMDRDGDLDLVVTRFGEPAGIYRNESAAGSGALIKLEGVKSNRMGVDARVMVEGAGWKRVEQVSLTRGFLSSGESMVHLGLGGEGMKDAKVKVIWPSGAVQEVGAVEGGRMYVVREEAGAAKGAAGEAQARPLFAEVTQESDLKHHQHVENAFDDEKLQPLIPYAVSRLGPAVAVADFNGDGREDLYLGGAAGKPGIVYVGDGAGGFYKPAQGALVDEPEREGAGAVFFDVDSDGDMDLFVAGGGYELGAQSPHLKDRLYLNDGAGGWTLAEDGEWARGHGSAAGPVAAGDLDGDGDLDLFIGSRVKAGMYPEAAGSRLLRNDKGKLVEATAALGPEVARAGMVRAAIFVDVNGDSKVDLVAATEWGPIRLYLNEGGRLVERTGEWGLAGLTGWWSSVAAVDVDGDGDMDLVAGNYGLNGVYRASAEKPALLFAGDLDDSGRVGLVEAIHEQGKIHPLRRRLAMLDAFPVLSEKFKTFHDYGRAEMKDVFGDKALAAARRLEATELRSGALINEGGKFRFVPLPVEAQMGPVFGMATADFNGDGRPDLALGQNHRHWNVESGAVDGAISVVLAGDGAGGWRAMDAAESGLAVTGDVRGMAAMDINGDGKADLVMGRNGGRAMLMKNQGGGTAGWRPLAVKLRGKKGGGNPTGVGAKILLTGPGGYRQAMAVTAGSGYLSQGSAAVYAAVGMEGEWHVEVNWPGGKVSRAKIEGKEPQLTLIEPE